MAEQEVIKHTKKLYKVWNSKEHGFWHKAKEFAIEIIIIVFAVTLSIQLHSWSEHKHEQQQVKSFLTGLRKDLVDDSSDIHFIRESYANFREVYTYLSKLDKEKQPNLDTLKTFIPAINSNVYLRTHQSRFNGFLSAGKILSIEDDSLSQMILNYYQEYIPMLKSSEAAWIDYNDELNKYLLDNLKDSSEISYWKVLTTTKANILIKKLIPWPQLEERYENVFSAGVAIIEKIDKLYPNEK